jgi:hypothetical protein
MVESLYLASREIRAMHDLGISPEGDNKGRVALEASSTSRPHDNNVIDATAQTSRPRTVMNETACQAMASAD